MFVNTAIIIAIALGLIIIESQFSLGLLPVRNV